MSVILARYSEIGLKSTPVRRKFENQLKDNALSMLMEDGVEAIVNKVGARFYIESEDIDAAVASLRKVFGLASLSVTEETGSTMEEICELAEKYATPRIADGQSFAVKARREGSQGYTSMDVGREVGSAIYEANKHRGITVNLTDPDVMIYVEVRDNRAFVFGDVIRCHAGFPVGSQGKVVAEVNDDRGLVSAWLMMKRGCRVIVHGTGEWELLRQYDPLLKEGTYHKQSLGFVFGYDINDLETFDATAYNLPVFFPTVGMTDEQVSAMVEVIRAGL